MIDPKGRQTPARSLFSCLAKYAATDSIQPVENFTSELLAWFVNGWPEFGRALAEILVPDTNATDLSVSAETQRWTPAGVIDVRLTVQSHGGRTDVIIENKVEAELGLRNGYEDPAKEEPPHVDPSVPSSQVDNYLRFADDAVSSHHVVLLTKRAVQEQPWWKDSRSWAGCRRWYEVDRLFDRLRATAPPEFQFLSDQFRAFMRDHGMTLERVTGALIDGTRDRVRLRAIVEEAANGVAARVGDVQFDGAGRDKYGVFAEWRLPSGGVAGVGYADARGDMAVYLMDTWYKTDEGLRSLATHARLPPARSHRERRFWGLPHLPIDPLDGEFFGLDAPSQVKRIEDLCVDILSAVVEVERKRNTSR